MSVCYLFLNDGELYNFSYNLRYLKSIRIYLSVRNRIISKTVDLQCKSVEWFLLCNFLLKAISD